MQLKQQIFVRNLGCHQLQVTEGSDSMKALTFKHRLIIYIICGVLTCCFALLLNKSPSNILKVDKGKGIILGQYTDCKRFKIIIDIPSTEIKVGEKININMQLHNITNDEFTLIYTVFPVRYVTKEINDTALYAFPAYTEDEPLTIASNSMIASTNEFSSDVKGKFVLTPFIYAMIETNKEMISFELPYILINVT